MSGLGPVKSSSRQLELPGVRPTWRHPRAVDARPFVKWAGGKTQLLGRLISRVPSSFARYFEPFVGGGALFFALQPRHARLSDVNSDLVQLYTVVRDRPEELIEALAAYRYDKELYYQVRARDPQQMSRVERAARMLYLNRTCFNGLYRVNRRGAFNVPFGRHKNPRICDTTGLRAASAALTARALACQPFERAVAAAEPGDFVYFDPPYHPRSQTSSFTSYTPWPFVEADQRRLAEVFARLAERGVRCMLSNSDTELVRELYAAWRVERVLATRRISRVADGRGPVGEVIVRSY